MAQRVHVVLEDDLDGSKAEETVKFGLDGSSYEVDLSKKNAARLRDSLNKYVEVARRTQTKRSSRRRRSSGPSAAEIRQWARENGMDVSERGRVPEEVRAAYEAAN